MLRELAPEKVPASCEQCRPVDLDAENRDIWDVVERFPGLLTRTPYATQRGPAMLYAVNYPAAIWMGERIGQPIEFIESLEAIAKGLNS